MGRSSPDPDEAAEARGEDRKPSRRNRSKSERDGRSGKPGQGASSRGKKRCEQREEEGREDSVDAEALGIADRRRAERAEGGARHPTGVDRQPGGEEQPAVPPAWRHLRE